MNHVITAEMVAKISEAVGPGRFFLILVKDDGAPTCDLASSARSEKDIHEATELIHLLRPKASPDRHDRN